MTHNLYRDIKLGIAGFGLGAVALLMPHQAEQRPVPPRGDTNVLAPTAASAPPHLVSRG
jgi:hypothetical protein